MLVTVEDSCFPSVAFSLSFEQSSFFTLSPLSSPGKVSANPWEGFYNELLKQCQLAELCVWEWKTDITSI